ncbi:hypothetical protein HQ706_04785 [Enterococcus faecium]|nr:hypothetical protein [Enterococcus faecium]
MNEFLMQLLKELEKNLHRSNVRSVGMGISQQIWAEKRLTDQNHQMTAEEAAQEFSNRHVQLKESVKGQFAEKLTELFQRQEKKLKQFR